MCKFYIRVVDLHILMKGLMPMIFAREIADALFRFAKLPVVGVFGPRQSGKLRL